MSFAWLDDRPVDPILAASRGLAYGDGIFRTILKYKNEFIDFEKHYIKFSCDARALDLKIPDASSLRKRLRQAAANTPSAVLKLIALRKDRRRGYAPAGRATHILTLGSPIPHYPASYWDTGILAADSPVRLASQPLLAGIKHLNRLEQVLASRDWPPGVDEVLLSDMRGRPICGSRSNLFWVRSGVLYTADLRACGISGMMRGKVLELAASLEIPCRLGQHARHSLEDADEVFVTNSLIGIWPLRGWNRLRWRAPGSLTRRLMQALAHPRLT